MEMKRRYTHPQLPSKEDLRGPGCVRVKKKKIKIKNLQTGWAHCGRSFSFALLQSETYKEEALGSVYPEAPPDGGKTKGTSHDPPWGSWNSPAPLLHFTLYSKYMPVASPPPRPHAEGAAHPPATPARSLSLFLSLHFTPLSLNRPRLLPKVSQDQNASFSNFLILNSPSSALARWRS